MMHNNITPLFSTVKQRYVREGEWILNEMSNDYEYKHKFLVLKKGQVDVWQFFTEYHKFIHLYDNTNYCIDIAINKSRGNDTPTIGEVVFAVKNLPKVQTTGFTYVTIIKILNDAVDAKAAKTLI